MSYMYISVKSDESDMHPITQHSGAELQRFLKSLAHIVNPSLHSGISKHYDQDNGPVPRDPTEEVPSSYYLDGMSRNWTIEYFPSASDDGRWRLSFCYQRSDCVILGVALATQVGRGKDDPRLQVAIPISVYNKAILTLPESITTVQS